MVGRAEGIGLLDARALGEHDQQPALLKNQPRGLDRVGVGLAAAHRKGAEPWEQPAEWATKELRLGHVAHVATGSDREEERVEKALVVRGDDRRALGRDVLGVRDANAEPKPQQRHHEQPHERVKRRVDARFAGSTVGAPEPRERGLARPVVLSRRSTHLGCLTAESLFSTYQRNSAATWPCSRRASSSWRTTTTSTERCAASAMRCSIASTETSGAPSS